MLILQAALEPVPDGPRTIPAHAGAARRGEQQSEGQSPPIGEQGQSPLRSPARRSACMPSTGRTCSSSSPASPCCSFVCRAAAWRAGGLRRRRARRHRARDGSELARVRRAGAHRLARRTELSHRQRPEADGTIPAGHEHRADGAPASRLEAPRVVPGRCRPRRRADEGRDLLYGQAIDWIKAHPGAWLVSSRRRFSIALSSTFSHARSRLSVLRARRLRPVVVPRRRPAVIVPLGLVGLVVARSARKDARSRPRPCRSRCCRRRVLRRRAIRCRFRSRSR